MRTFKMEVDQTNFVTCLIITVQLYYWLSKNPSVKIWSNTGKFQIVMIGSCIWLIIVSSVLVFKENLMSKFMWTEQKWNFKVVFNSCAPDRSCCHGNCENAEFYLSIKIFIRRISQLVCCNLSFAMIWQMTHTHKLPKLCPCTAPLNFRVCSCSLSEQ